MPFYGHFREPGCAEQDGAVLHAGQGHEKVRTVYQLGYQLGTHAGCPVWIGSLLVPMS